MLKTFVGESVLVKARTHTHMQLSWQSFQPITYLTLVLKIQYSYNLKHFFVHSIIHFKICSDLFC